MSIKIDLMIILFLLLFCMTSQIEIYLILMLFACIHEIGHLCVGLLLGFKPKEVQINPMGMRIEFKPQIEEYNQKIGKANTLAIKKTIVAVAGPMTNFIIIFITMIAMYINEKLLISNLCTTIIYANFLIGFFNLIPIYPLDGGRIVKEILHITKGLKESYTYTYKISKITIVVLTAISSIAILYIQNIAIIIILIYLWGLVVLERRKYLKKKLIYNKIIEKEMKMEPTTTKNSCKS